MKTRTPEAINESLRHLDVEDVRGEKINGWWGVTLFTAGRLTVHTGKKARDYYTALSNAIDVAIKEAKQ